MFEIKCFVTNASLNVNKLFSYCYKEDISKYKRVSILFNKSKTSGIVIETRKIDDLKEYENKIGYKLSQVLEVLDDEPIISCELYDLANWLSKTTISPFISCLNAMLPKAMRTSKKLTKPKFVEYITKNNIEDIKLTCKQLDTYNLYSNDMLASKARSLSTNIFNSLKQKGAISLYKKEAIYQNNDSIVKEEFKDLTSDQQKVYDGLLNTDKLVSLLYGVTGSGKTEVYLHLAANYLKQNKEVLILVPEISLTPQMIDRVKKRFNDVIFYHSELNDQERYEQYKRVKNGEVKIVVGTRSSIFLPFNNLGLIIIDEEHDNSYKQDTTPCYNVKNVAIKRALHFKAKVLLASATPSLDSFTRAKKNEYQLLILKERINKQFPIIELVDLTNEIKKRSSYIISSKLKDELQNTLNNHKQAIILLNRRGYSPIVKCSECKTTLMCSDCDIPLNYHKDENVLKCHQCGKIYKTTKYCPKCHNESLIYYGFGTKKVEEELHKLFPSANIERMDRDAVNKKNAHKEILDKLDRKQIDILIGTQMIAKGLDYPDVTLVGILNADAGLARQDYNSCKMTFDLLMQASGRSGRSIDPGKVIIQAFNLDHYVLKAVLSQDYEYFYNIEMNYRSIASYPPYAHLLQIIVSSTNDNYLNNSLDFLTKKIDKLPFKHYNPYELTRIKKERRYRILLSNKELKPLIDETWTIIDEYLTKKALAKIKVDVDPLYLE